MNKHVAYKTRLVSNVLDFLKDGKMSQINYDSSNMPFFIKDNSNNFNIDYHNIPELPNGLNRNIKTMYKLISNPQIEVYIRDWTIMSLNRAFEVYYDYVNNGQTQVFDIGFMYVGMGHIKVISCDLKNHQLFFRIDGGGDGHARDYHRNLILNYNPNNYNHMFFTDFVKETKIKNFM